MKQKHASRNPTPATARTTITIVSSNDAGADDRDADDDGGEHDRDAAVDGRSPTTDTGDDDGDADCDDDGNHACNDDGDDDGDGDGPCDDDLLSDRRAACCKGLRVQRWRRKTYVSYDARRLCI